MRLSVFMAGGRGIVQACRESEIRENQKQLNGLAVQDKD